MKRKIYLLLSLVIMLSVLSGCGKGTDIPQETQKVPAQELTNVEETVTPDEEIQKAIDLGFVPETLQDDYDLQINYAEFLAVLDAVLEETKPECMGAWKSRVAEFGDKDTLMSRFEGVMVLFYAAECAEVEELSFRSRMYIPDYVVESAEFWDGMDGYDALPPSVFQSYENESLANTSAAWINGETYGCAAVHFAQNYSYGNGKTYFDYDENYILRLGDILTRGDAIRAAERLYETIRFSLYEPSVEVNCTVSAEAITTGAAMPEVSWQKLPNWYGYTVSPGNWNAYYGSGMNYQKEFIDVLGEQGFNFVRVPLDSRMIFQGSNMNMVNPAYLETMDDLIDYCAENSIHVCFDLHDMPGFYTGGDASLITLWHDEETQELFVQFWQFMAEYYKDVPTNLLSFNLLNEPHSFDDEPSDELYSKLMLRAIEAIREVTSDRLIFADTLGVSQGIPVYGLKDAQVVQAVHPYFMKDGAQSWPSYVIHGFVNRSSGDLTIQGDFPAGTKITANIIGVHGQSEISLLAAGNALASLELGAEAIGENGCISISEEGTEGEFRFYDGVPLAGELTETCKQIKIVQKNGMWYRLGTLTVETDNYAVTLTSDNDMVSNGETPILTIDENGIVSARNDSTMITQNREWLEDLFRNYQEFTEETGMQIMVQEFGFNETIDYQATLAAAEDLLSILDGHDIPWCSWCGNFGPILDNRQYEREWIVSGEKIDIRRSGAEYEMISENYMMDTGLMEVYQKHMK